MQLSSASNLQDVFGPLHMATAVLRRSAMPPFRVVDSVWQIRISDQISSGGRRPTSTWWPGLCQAHAVRSGCMWCLQERPARDVCDDTVCRQQYQDTVKLGSKTAVATYQLPASHDVQMQVEHRLACSARCTLSLVSALQSFVAAGILTGVAQSAQLTAIDSVIDGDPVAVCAALLLCHLHAQCDTT